MSSKLFLIGFGHRARNGKDSVANFIMKKRSNVILYHFADPLKEEVMNSKREFPLIYREKRHLSNHYWYSIWSNDNNHEIIGEENVPFLHKIFEDRKIDIYWGMNGNGNDEHKDSLMLQFWGTNWRRQRFGEDYWINKVEWYFRDNAFSKQFKENAFFILPDTRFRNEVEFIKAWNDPEQDCYSYYVKVERYNADGTQYYDPNRDKNHPSEVDLENTQPDYLIRAHSGEMEVLEKQTELLLDELENK